MARNAKIAKIAKTKLLTRGRFGKPVNGPRQGCQPPNWQGGSMQIDF